MDTHFCKKCSTIKPVVEFSKTKSTYKGKTYVNVQSACKACMRARWTEWKTENPEKVKEKDRARKRCVDEWNPMKTPVAWHTMRQRSTSKYTRTDIALTKSPIILCNCGNRYLKTRKGQTRCLPCIAYSVVI